MNMNYISNDTITYMKLWASCLWFLPIVQAYFCVNIVYMFHMPLFFIVSGH